MSWAPPRWTPVLRSEEPAHGLYLRLCDTNGLARSAIMRTLTGVRCERVWNGRDLHALAEISKCPMADLERSAFRGGSGRAIRVREHVLDSRDDLLKSPRRSCPDCLNESHHHRLWWDLAFIATCPRHLRRLASHCSCGRPLSWKDGLLARCFACDHGDVAAVAVEEADIYVVELDRWFLAQLGVGDVSLIPPALHGLQLRQAIQVIERTAVLDLLGYDDPNAGLYDLHMDAAKARAHGFRLIYEGRLEALLDRVHAGNVGDWIKLIRDSMIR
nr:TniQ family protein [Bosea sp. ASV33]